jgi:hypothetical protein
VFVRDAREQEAWPHVATARKLISPKLALKEVLLARFLTIGYGDRAGYDRTDASIRHAAHEHDERLRATGALIGIAGQPVQVRNHDAPGVGTKEGRFLRSDLPVAGFAVIEARSLEDAVGLASKTPCAVSHGVVEVWPLLSTAHAAPTSPSA